MTTEPAQRNRKFSLAELQDAVETIALAQAQIGVAVLTLLGESTSIPTDDPDQLRQRVAQSVEKLIEVSRQLLDTSDGA